MDKHFNSIVIIPLHLALALVLTILFQRPHHYHLHHLNTATSVVAQPKCLRPILKLRQCQHLVSFICYEAIFSRKTMNKKEFAATLFDYYHGVEQRPTLINHAWYFVNGRGKFSCAFDNSNDDGLNRLLPELTQEDNSFIVNELLIEGKKKSSTLQ